MCFSTLLTEEFDEIATLGEAGGKDTESIRSARVLATDLDGDGRPSGAGLDAMCSGELDKIGHTNTSVGLNGLEVTAKTLQTPILGVGTLVGEDQRSVTGAVEAIVEG